MENWQKRNGLFRRNCLLVYNNCIYTSKFYTSKWRTGGKEMDGFPLKENEWMTKSYNLDILFNWYVNDGEATYARQFQKMLQFFILIKMIFKICFRMHFLGREFPMFRIHAWVCRSACSLKMQLYVTINCRKCLPDSTQWSLTGSFQTSLHYYTRFQCYVRSGYLSPSIFRHV